MNHYWGAVLGKSAAVRLDRAAEAGLENGDVCWRHSHARLEMLLRAGGAHWQVSEFGDCVLLVRGTLVLTENANRTAKIDAAKYVQQHYRKHGDLPIDELEGGFTLVLLDAQAGRAVLYRNLVGAGFTYYTRTLDGLFFGSNLAELVEHCGAQPRANDAALPAFFLFRAVPGRQTLFEDVFRLMPGEQVIFDANGLTHKQRQSFADLASEQTIGADAVDYLEAVMHDILTDRPRACPDPANLLSRGAYRSYLQAVWNQVNGEQEPLSVSVSVDHPRTRPDAEYATSAAKALGTQHRLVPADAPYIRYLLESLAVTGEPPNHVMTAYFPELARTMQARGVSTALCGEGADSLFGLPSADLLRTAQRIRSWLPAAALRQPLGAVARLCGRKFFASACQTAGVVHDERAWTHPLNQAAVFTDLPAVAACFGGEAVSTALADRRQLLDQYDVPDEPRHRLHAVGYLGEAMDTASLWTNIFNSAGGDLCCPYLDSRLLRVVSALSPRRRFPKWKPKDLLKRALARHVPSSIVDRRKLGFGQPIFEWLAPGGQLRPWVERIANHHFVDVQARTVVLSRPNWFLYSLLCYDLWHRLFIDRSLSRHSLVAAPHAAEAVAEEALAA